MSRDSAGDPISKSSSRIWPLVLGACSRSSALQYQAFPDDVSMQRTGVGLFVDWPICEYADKPRTRAVQ